ncbi:8035_t:CDS:2, partial [Cetraspora pellucida]
TYRKSVIINRICFIASDIGGCLLIISNEHDDLERIKMDLSVHRFHNKNLTFDYDLIDFYNLLNPVNAEKLFRCLKAKIKMPYIIKSDFIIYTNEEKLFIKKLTYEEYLTNWNLSCKDIIFALEVAREKFKVFRENRQELVHIKNMFISVHYIWGVDKDISDKYWEEIFNDSLTEKFLLQSDFNGIIKEANNKSDKDTTNLYNLLLENYIEDNFF